MSHTATIPRIPTSVQEMHGPEAALTPPRTVPVRPDGRDARAAEMRADLAEADCIASAPVRERLDFETLLADLSATFVNLRADQVDAQIEKALRRLAKFLGIDRVGLAELSPEQKQIVITHSYHAPGTPPLGRFILDEQFPWYAKAVRRGEVLRLSAMKEQLPSEAAAERDFCTREGLKSHLMIPLKVMGSVVGAIGFSAFRGYREWPDELIRRLRLVGEIFTNAVARKRADEALIAREVLLCQARERMGQLAAKLIRAQEEERRRIAREMHDDWTQRLAVLAIETTKLEQELKLSQPGKTRFRVIREGLVTLSEDVHALSRQLHPSILDDLGLVEAVRSECASFTRRERIAVVYHPEEIPAGIPKDVAMCIYRVTQEALRNIARHAAVKTAWVSLNVVTRGGTNGSSTNLAELELRIEDKGAGFDPASKRPQPGLGLASMEERVRLVGATLSVTSAVGRGTTIVVRVPLAA